ncbi:MAG: hypothetical protein AAB368_16640, partial [bacterium]
GYEGAYYYYDPVDGALKGPVAALGIANSNMVDRLLFNEASTVNIPIVPTRVKMWSVGVTCGAIPGYSTTTRVSRMIVQITMRGQDDTGKDLSAQGNIAVNLEDIAPGPLKPTGGATTADNFCYGMSFQAYWQGYCK